MESPGPPGLISLPTREMLTVGRQAPQPQPLRKEAEISCCPAHLMTEVHTQVIQGVWRGKPGAVSIWICLGVIGTCSSRNAVQDARAAGALRRGAVALRVSWLHTRAVFTQEVEAEPS